MSHIHSCSLHSLVSSQAIKTHCLVARGLSVSNRGERQIKVQELSPLLDGAFAPVAASHTCETQEDFGCLAHKLLSALLTPWALVGKLSFNLSYGHHQLHCWRAVIRSPVLFPEGYCEATGLHKAPGLLACAFWRGGQSKGPHEVTVSCWLIKSLSKQTSRTNGSFDPKTLLRKNACNVPPIGI